MRTGRHGGGVGAAAIRAVQLTDKGSAVAILPGAAPPEGAGDPGELFQSTCPRCRKSTLTAEANGNCRTCAAIVPGSTADMFARHASMRRDMPPPAAPKPAGRQHQAKPKKRAKGKAGAAPKRRAAASSGGGDDGAWRPGCESASGKKKRKTNPAGATSGGTYYVVPGSSTFHQHSDCDALRRAYADAMQGSELGGRKCCRVCKNGGGVSYYGGGRGRGGGGGQMSRSNLENYNEICRDMAKYGCGGYRGGW